MVGHARGPDAGRSPLSPTERKTREDGRCLGLLAVLENVEPAFARQGQSGSWWKKKQASKATDSTWFSHSCPLRGRPRGDKQIARGHELRSDTLRERKTQVCRQQSQSHQGRECKVVVGTELVRV